MRTGNLLFMYSTGVSYYTMKSILLNVKKTSNLIKGISSNNICSGIKSQQVKKNIFHSVPKTWFLQNSSVPFHQVIFDHLISCVLLIDKPNESCQNFKKFERNDIFTTKKGLKRKGSSITPAKTNAPISQTSSESLKLTIQKLWTEKQRT